MPSHRDRPSYNLSAQYNTPRNRARSPEYANTEGGLGKVHQRFDAKLPKVIEDLNESLAA